MATRVEIAIEGGDVLVRASELLTHREARLYFRSVLGAQPTDHGWRCPSRRLTPEELAVQVANYLERAGWHLMPEGEAADAITRDHERRLSFERTRIAASQWLDGQLALDPSRVRQALHDFGWSPSRPLRPHQERAVLHALTVANAANFSVPGSGKTASALAAATVHLHEGTIDLIVVVGPLSSFGPWEYETAQAVGERIPVQRIRGTAQQRAGLYEGIPPDALLLLSFATAVADRRKLVQLCRRRRVLLVVDEAHRIKRFRGGVWAEALMDIAKWCRARMILTGTPMPQSGRDLFSQLRVLWPGGELTGPRDHFAAMVDNEFGHVLDLVRPFATRTAKSELGLPELHLERHEVELTGTQEEVYRLIATQLRRAVESTPITDDRVQALGRARPIRLLQTAANPNLLNQSDTYFGLPAHERVNPTLHERLERYGETEVPAKSKAAIRILQEIVNAGEKVVCWSTFIGNLDDFSRLVRTRLGVPCFQVDGRIPVGDESAQDDDETREQIIERFLETPGPAVLVANPAACSESISLHRSCRNAVYLDRSYDCAQFLQSLDRIHRLGLAPDARVTAHIILATLDGAPTIDHLVDDSLRRKEERMRQLLEGAEVVPLQLAVEPLRDAEGDLEDLRHLLDYLLGGDGGSE